MKIIICVNVTPTDVYKRQETVCLQKYWKITNNPRSLIVSRTYITTTPRKYLLQHKIIYDIFIMLFITYIVYVILVTYIFVSYKEELKKNCLKRLAVSVFPCL